MDRRRFMQLLVLGSAAVAAGKLMVHGRRRGLSFYVAGARFGELPAGVGPGDRLRMRREAFGSEARFSLHTLDGHLLGYVPRELVPTVETLRPVEAQVKSVCLDSVPWKRYEVELVVGS